MSLWILPEVQVLGEALLQSNGPGHVHPFRGGAVLVDGGSHECRFQGSVCALLDVRHSGQGSCAGMDGAGVEQGPLPLRVPAAALADVLDPLVLGPGAAAVGPRGLAELPRLSQHIKKHGKRVARPGWDLASRPL